MIFVDAGAWFASAVTADQSHVAAVRWLAQNRVQLLTTDYIIDETLTLLRARQQPRPALSLGQHFFDGTLAQVYYLTPDDIQAAWQIFQRYSDKEWSFTDCTSKVVMDRLGITTAFTFDHHFRQFGGITVVP